MHLRVAQGQAGGDGVTDLLRWPVVGPALRRRHARTAAQLTLLCAAAAIVAHGLFGPQFAPSNLATVATWIHYRGLLVITLLAAGNFFCMGCPLVRVRDWGRRLHAPRLRWPRALRSKWIGIVLFAGVLFCYELFDLWSLPAGTAWLVIAYFAAAVAIDLLFAGAVFCKHLCPIGQFNFVASTASPLEVRVKDRGTCRTCGTFDCIKGRPSTGQRGCELGLFLPSKVGNMDCTFCLDCVHACPHDNVALTTRLPGAELLETGRRSGIGRLANRRDLAALVVLFTFGGLLNAFAMTMPAHRFHAWVSSLTGGAPEAVWLGVLFAIGLVATPLVLLGGAAGLTGLTTRSAGGSMAATAARYAYALAPLGFGVWLAHYSFHFLTGALTIVPVAQSAVQDLLGWAALGDPLWRWSGMRPGAVFPIEVGFVLLGAAGSVALVCGISERDERARSGATAAPWSAVVLALAAFAIWTFAQPMEMRGMAM